ncbi:MAG: hypothetical protein OCC49_10100 [Fibrobacterales bacterium]
MQSLLKYKIIWDDSFSVGNSKMDAQHRIIINKINKLIDLCHNDNAISYSHISEAICFMTEYSLKHFEAEEKMLMNVHLPVDELKQHIEYHNVFMDKSTFFCKRVLKEHRIIIPEMVEYFSYWWNDHILIHDMAYKQLLKPTVDKIII